MSDTHAYVEIGEDDYILLVSPFPPQQLEQIQRFGEVTGDMMAALFEQVLEADPELTKFLATVNEVKLSYDLIGGWSADDEIVLAGPAEAIKQAYYALPKSYSCKILDGPSYQAYLQAVIASENETESFKPPEGGSAPTALNS